LDNIVRHTPDVTEARDHGLATAVPLRRPRSFEVDGGHGAAGRPPSPIHRFQRLTSQQQRSGSGARLVRDPEVYAKGKVRHPDHATIELADWHRGVMSTQHGARAMQYVELID